MSEQVIFGFSKPVIHNVTEQNKPTGTKRELRNGSVTLAVGQKVHFNVSPLQEDGEEYPGYSPEVRSWRRTSGPGVNANSPIIQHRWGVVGGEELSNSGNDPFHLGSYEDDGGCTPTLVLRRPIGKGRVQVYLESFVDEKDNGGVGLVSERTTFYCD